MACHVCSVVPLRHRGRYNDLLWRLQGSIEQAVAQVEAFRGSLEHRVVARFDDAVSAGNLGGMAECARIMAEFRQGESQLVQVCGFFYTPVSRCLCSQLMCTFQLARSTAHPVIMLPRGPC